MAREMTLRSARRVVLLLATVAPAASCTYRFKGHIGAGEEGSGAGAVGGGGGGDPTGGTGGFGGGLGGAPQIPIPSDCEKAPVNPGPSPLRRLTRAEYNNTVHDLLNDRTAPANLFPDEEIALGFTNNADAQSVSGLLVEQYETAAASLASAAVGNLNGLLGCNPTSGDDCIKSFISNFGLRAYRRPLSKAESDRLFAFYSSNKQSSDVTTAVRLMVQALLQSPSFIYRIEGAGTALSATVSNLTGYEMASRLSYLLWSTMPDAELFAAAGSGKLDSTNGILEQAQRMLKDPRTNQSVGTFVKEWLDLNKLDKVEKDARLFPQFNPTLRGLMRQETELFSRDVMLNGGKLETLLGGNYSFMNRTLATYYGLTGPAGDAFEKTMLDTSKRTGVMTQAGLMASYAKIDQTSPVTRGVFVKERFLCSTPSPPPNNVRVSPPVPDPTLTTRERFARHRADPACAGCHNTMDPIGFGFEHYDAIGRWRDTEGTLAVDASGEIVGTRDADGPFNGAGELATRLSRSAQVRECMVSYWFRYAYGRGDSASEDKCVLGALNLAFASGDFKQLLLALTQTDAFLHREVSQ
jgi:uncharacterized protein DUF1592/uncharacterized protein DUF1588/uncharacterized protein DUF1587/uncharacterized protein DUF1595/uncharacterized protein DUF1585